MTPFTFVTKLLRYTNSIQKIQAAFATTALFVLSACVASPPLEATTIEDIVDLYPDWQQEFNLANRKLSDTGESEFFILVPGYQLVLQSDTELLTITVLDETKKINGLSTRVLEERELRNDNLYEVSRNFYAIDNATGDVFYFGEEVDFYENGEVVRHSGEWLAYENGNLPGLIMGGTPEIGMKYFQEIALNIALDRAEVVSLTESFTTPAGTFEDCLVTSETSPLEPNVKERKTYASGIGLIQDERLLLVSYGYLGK